MKKYFVGGLFIGILMLTGCSVFGDNDNTTDDQTDQTTIENNDNTLVSEENGKTTDDVLDDVYKVEDNEQVLNKAKELFNLANDLALDWQSDAKLLLVSSKYFSSLKDDGVVDKFIFSSDLQPRYYWAIDISRSDTSKFTRTLIFRDDYILKKGVLNIPIKYWKVSYAEAMEKADILGGYQYRQDHPNYQISQMLSLADNNNLAWYIVYTSPDSEEILSIVIDASSGEQIA
ncbi:MAG: hypothetical protein WC570_01465 [Patescibacteria group bacterium]